MALLDISLTLALALLVTGQLYSKESPPNFSSVPDTSFNCLDHMAGYYADMEAGCQAYHMCDTLGKQYSYLCPNNTVFNQRFMVCDHWHHVNCSNSDKYYELNMRMAGGGQKVRQSQRMANHIQDDEPQKPKTKGDKLDQKKKIKEVKDLLRRVQQTTSNTPRPRPQAHSFSTTSSKASTTTPRRPILRPITVTPRPTIRTTFSSTTTFRRLSSTASSTSNRQIKEGVSGSTIKFRPITLPRTTTSTTARTTESSTERKRISSPRGGVNTTNFVTSPIMPFMFARNSGPRRGFSFTNLVDPPLGHTDIPKEGIRSPFLGEFLRHLLAPRKPQGNLRTIEESRSARNRELDSNSLSTERPNTTQSKFSQQTNRKSFPVQPIIIENISTIKPIVMSGPRQEDITELTAKRNGQSRTNRKFGARISPLANEAFFIPETKLIPPDRIKLSIDVKNEISEEITTDDPRQSSDLDDGSITGTDEDHSHMTMIFPKFNPSKQQTFAGILLNPSCPECHPGFLTPGKCTPCVRIR